MPVMHGPAFDDSGKIVERDVPSVDIPAYQKAGYEMGAIPVADAEEVEEPKEEAPKPKPKKKGKK